MKWQGCRWNQSWSVGKYHLSICSNNWGRPWRNV